MPVLANPRHERIAQGLAKGLNRLDAYKKSGFARMKDDRNNRSEACKLARRPEIRARVKELQEGQAKRIGVTVDKLVAELDDMLALAAKVKHPAAGVGAILGKAKLLGLIVEKAEIDATMRKPSRSPTDKKQLSLAAWTARFAPKEPLQ